MIDAAGRPTPRAPHRARGSPRAPAGARDFPTTAEALRAAAQRATDRCRECPIGEHATQAVLGEGPAHARADVRRRAARRPGGPARPALRRAGRPAARPRAARSSAWPRDAVYVTNAVKHFKFELRGKRRIHKTPAAAGSGGLPALARERDRAGAARRARRPRRDGCAPAAGRPVAVMRERGHWLERSRRPAGAGHAASVGAAARRPCRTRTGLQRRGSTIWRSQTPMLRCNKKEPTSL